MTTALAPLHPRSSASTGRQALAPQGWAQSRAPGAEFLWLLGGGPIGSTRLSAQACRCRTVRGPGLRPKESSPAPCGPCQEGPRSPAIHIRMDESSSRAISEWTKVPAELYQNGRRLHPSYLRTREGSVRDIRERARAQSETFENARGFRRAI